jgi:hypothetical protein
LDDKPVVLNVYIDGLAYDTAAKIGTVFTTDPYTVPVVETFITAGKSPFWDPSGYEPMVICITASYHITCSD